MILAKAPLRVSFFGGSSDIPEHYQKHGGATLSMAIDKYVYVSVMHTPKKHVKVTYSVQEDVTDINDIKNDIVRNALIYFGIYSNIEINVFADIPTVGSGLGGSSAFTCALLAALIEYLGENPLSPYDLAYMACRIEIERCGWKIGKQDQYASAFGGVNYIEYSADTINHVTVTKSRLPSKVYDCMALVPTNIQRHSAEILEKIDFKKQSNLINQLADHARLWHKEGWREHDFQFLINESWKIKKQLEPNITNPEIDALMYSCIEKGAGAVKLLGAGGGGYILCVGSKADITSAFGSMLVSCVEEGAKVVYVD